MQLHVNTFFIIFQAFSQYFADENLYLWPEIKEQNAEMPVIGRTANSGHFSFIYKIGPYDSFRTAVNAVHAAHPFHLSGSMGLLPRPPVPPYPHNVLDSVCDLCHTTDAENYGRGRFIYMIHPSRITAAAAPVFVVMDYFHP